MSTLEQITRLRLDAEMAYTEQFRDWLRAKKVTIESPDHETALKTQFNLESEAELRSLERLRSDEAVARAELERRWIEAHEDLAVLRKAGILQPRQ